MNPLRRTSLPALLALLIPLSAVAVVPIDQKPDVSIDPAVREFAAQLAREDGLKEADVLAVLAGAEKRQSILDAISRPAEGKAWKDYRPIFLTDKRVDDGIAFVNANRELLDKVSAEYGVPIGIIAAIIGVETSYGKNIGSYRVIDALSTLAFYYPKRAKFFRAELRALFLLNGKHLAYPLDELKGSYAGAMGLGQFMPSSIANYAVSYDGDDRIDLWNSMPDITASVASYFAGHGWEKDQPVAVRAIASDTATDYKPENLEASSTVQQLEAWGYSPLEHADAERPATLLTLEGEHGPERWITFKNFYVISRYNRSALYSMAVFQLAGEITAGVASAK